MSVIGMVILDVPLKFVAVPVAPDPIPIVLDVSSLVADAALPVIPPDEVI